MSQTTERSTHPRAPEILVLVLKNMPPADIARRLGMTKAGVIYAIRTMRDAGQLPRVPRDQHRDIGARARPVRNEQVKCLSCSETFLSFDRARNRICPRCRKNAS